MDLETMYSDRMQKWQDFCHWRHDTYCNQKYGEGDSLPYSFHLQAVYNLGYKFIHLIPDVYVGGQRDAEADTLKELVLMALSGHDLIEDARMTYNDVVNEAMEFTTTKLGAETIANIIYACTDEKGKNRRERKNTKYYDELSNDIFATFVKFCDIGANTMYSKLVSSDMYEMYKKEFTKVKIELYDERLEKLINYIENI